MVVVGATVVVGGTGVGAGDGAGAGVGGTGVGGQVSCVHCKDWVRAGGKGHSNPGLSSNWQ
jgi:hypothetical protein